ncbi:undecaprenyldiphospho-muramoylpentapeptide beta-N-acetylglucosaminyltransferase [Paenibacillus selenitireducens]|uniref:UDP-N-acetylglucosamine--N-acetylmuramyl-(pentapeptide) pyrophosphoryl-undecaprenol N-acetylglucosamine transferase n=1 Tax=Paenibacillus selenitireducens TaxID=1324314 RepID=A0A1T2XC15_9BACL|nr:undecaprenyldiphospho-muramoylpentapeptide beta-N-acetylglucosaminyltransferase [Paenibacillus selenitireducens]OPA77431.1 undecaprenyldiphospho-muramoylpentapeptide beta-N-acetylglucosaminyltransferase [Paenibacillus selenitireducens]
MKGQQRILFTGGGSAGHVTVNLALIPKLKKLGWDITYMGSQKGIEAQLIRNVPDVKYFGISTGKLRRYVDLENIKDPFRVVKGVFQAYRNIRTIRPDIVFSKGGFVSVPVVLGAWMNRVPVIIHESDLTPGLANRIAIRFATRICLTFSETAQYIGGDKAVHAGAIIREEIQQGDARRGRVLCQFKQGIPVIMVMGGSLGARKVNEAIRSNLAELTKSYQIIHICGKDQVDHSIRHPRYVQFEYVQEELADLLAMTDLVVSRAGSNSIFEFLALGKPMLLIPLSRQASRGDQILNAESFRKSGYCEVLLEEELNDQSFLQALRTLAARRLEIQSNMSQVAKDQAIETVVALIQNISKS